MTRYTPGPWDVVEGRTLLHVETQIDHLDGAGKAICSLPRRDKANARLIAKAPEMRDALLETLGHLILTGTSPALENSIRALLAEIDGPDNS